MARRFELLEVGGSPRQIGLQVGEALRDRIPLAIDQIFDHELTYYDAMTFGDVPPIAKLSRGEVFQRTREFLPLFERYAPDMVEELRGIAEGARIDFEEALLLQIRGEIVYAMTTGCTAFALTGRVTTDGRSIVGQNWDYAVDLDAGIMHLLHVTPDDGPRRLMMTFAGLTSYLGMNSAGVSVFANALPWRWCEVGVPHYPLWWRIFQERDLDGVRAVFAETRTSQAANQVMSDGTGAIADAELTPDGVAWLDDSDGFIVHTNHYLGAPYAGRTDLPSFLTDSEPRLARIRELVTEGVGHLDVAGMSRILADHAGHPQSICRHEREPGFWTTASMIAVPERGVMFVCAGNPCEGEYVEYTV